MYGHLNVKSYNDFHYANIFYERKIYLILYYLITQNKKIYILI